MALRGLAEVVNGILGILSVSGIDDMGGGDSGPGVPVPGPWLTVRTATGPGRGLGGGARLGCVAAWLGAGQGSTGQGSRAQGQAAGQAGMIGRQGKGKGLVHLYVYVDLCS